MKNRKKDYNSLLDNCISYEDVARDTLDINNLINYYSKNILMITYAKLMLKGTSLTSKGLEGSVVVFALPVGQNDEGKVLFSINEAVVQADTAKKVNTEVQKIYRNSLKNVPQKERFDTTEQLVISEIKANQEEISKLSSTKSLNISDTKYTWDEYSKKFFDVYGYEPTEFDYGTWIEYKTTMIDTRNLKWSNEKKDTVVEQLHDGAREVQGMTMNQLLQPYDLLGTENIVEDTIEEDNNIEEDTIDEPVVIDNEYGKVEVDDDNFDIEAFMKPTIEVSNEIENDNYESNYDKSEFKFFNGDVDSIDDIVDNNEIIVEPDIDNEDDITIENETSNEVEEDNSLDEETIADTIDEKSSLSEDTITDSVDEELDDLFKRIKFIKYDDLVGTQNEEKNDDDDFFQRLSENFEEVSHERKM